MALGEPFYVSLATRILIMALAAASLNLILGFGGMVSFGHAAFVGIGGYVVGIAFVHAGDGSAFLGLLPGTTNGLVLLPLAMLVAGLIALPIGAVCLRTTGISFIMITLAFAQMLFYLLVSLRRYNGQDGIAVWQRSSLPWPIDLNDRVSFYYLALAVLVAFLALTHRLVGSRFGRVLRAAKDNERRARALGFHTYRYKLVAFVLAGAVAGLAGALFANATGFVGPSYLRWDRSGDLIVMVVIGGIGTLAGPALGATLLMLLEEFMPEALDGLVPGLGEHWKIFLGPILILIVLYARRGLAGLIDGVPGGALWRHLRPEPEPGKPPRRWRKRR
ncbi:MAG: branched-chain amino acid ABC transporter permease [Rhodospirillaceae bacterium]|nr:branched-chain amino acid ABC transporter permease [Rhodospirillaceae bacterium]